MSSRPRWKDDPLRAELRALYDEVDQTLAPFACDRSGECCDFGLTGREPYPTAVELREVQHALDAAPAPRRSLPLAGRSDRACPMLEGDGRCRIYASRPFGCRTFFCERATGPKKIPRADLLRLGKAVTALSARFDPRDPHPRPFVRALARRFAP